jgi:hypothetical protein
MSGKQQAAPPAAGGQVFDPCARTFRRRRALAVPACAVVHACTRAGLAQTRAASARSQR